MMPIPEPDVDALRVAELFDKASISLIADEGDEVQAIVAAYAPVDFYSYCLQLAITIMTPGQRRQMEESLQECLEYVADTD
jgi:hypothetical protein